MFCAGKRPSVRSARVVTSIFFSDFLWLFIHFFPQTSPCTCLHTVAAKMKRKLSFNIELFMGRCTYFTVKEKKNSGSIVDPVLYVSMGQVLTISIAFGL